MRPSPTTFPPYFNTYIKLIPESNIVPALKNQANQAEKFLGKITEEQSLYKYSEEKWTVREILQHVIDTERIFNYRALAIARKDPNRLASFNENSYAALSAANFRSFSGLLEEFIQVRKSTVFLFQSFTSEMLDSEGTISDYHMTTLALGFTIAGHGAHHINIIRERYFDVDEETF